MNSKIAIVGGAGFVGTRLAKRFSEDSSNFNIYDIDTSSDVKSIIWVDVEKAESLSKLDGADIIINLAAVHRDDIRPLSRYDDVNVQGARNICETARKYNINKVVFTSSVAIYGFAPADTGESGEPNYFNDYGRTKYLAEQVFKEWFEEAPDERMLFIVRPTVIFGEGNRGNVYNLLTQIASGRFVMFGSGNNVKSMAYVENVVAFLQYATGIEKGLHIYNYIDKPDFNMNFLVSKARSVLFGKRNVGLRLPAFLGIAVGVVADFVVALAGGSLPVSSIRVKKFMATTQFDTAVKNLDFVAPVKIEDGLEKTLRYEFLEKNLNKRTFDTE